MANAENFTEFVQVNFSLLSDSDEIYDMQLDSNVTQEEVQQVESILEQANTENPKENDDESEVFDGELKRSRHVTCSADKVDKYAEDEHALQTKFQTKWAVNVLRDWLTARNKDPSFEELPDEILAGLLRQFFAEVRQKNGKPYSKSGMVNLRSGVNRYLQSPPNNRIINLMHNAAFQNANKVFVGVLKNNKREGLDVRKPRVAISKGDLEKVYDNYLLPGLATGDFEVLQLKVFFDLVYLMGRRGKEGLRQLQKDWFQISKDDEGTEYVKIIVNEVTKKNQGDRLSTSDTYIHDDNNPMFAQPGSPRCPVASFKQYIQALNPKINDFFQRVNRNKKKFDAMAVGVHTIRSWMPLISERAGLSRRYTNHNIRKTTATGMHKGNVAIPNIAHHLKHKDILTLKHYLEKPSLEDKKDEAAALHNYTVSNPEDLVPRRDDPPPNPAPQPLMNYENAVEPQQLMIQNKENITEANAVVPFEANLDENVNIATAAQPLATNNQQLTQNNQFQKQAPVMFGGATFNNCSFTFQMPQ